MTSAKDYCTVRSAGYRSWACSWTLRRCCGALGAALRSIKAEHTSKEQLLEEP